MAFVDRLFRKRNPLESIIGFAGGNLGEQLNREGAIPRGDVNVGQEPQRPVMLTPQNQEVVTRPRRTYNTTLNPEEEQQFEIWKQQNAPNDSGQDYDLRGAFKAGVIPNADRHWPDTFKKPNHPTFSNESQYAQGADAQRAGSWQGETFKPSPFAQRLLQPSQSRERRTQPRDFVADDTQYLRDLENKPLSLRDKAGMVSQVIARGLGGQPLPTRRERALTEAQGTLGRDVAIEKQQIAKEQGQMVPVVLNNGQTVMVPARTAGNIANQQQRVGQADERIDLAGQRLRQPKYTKDAQGRIVKISPQTNGSDKVETISNVTKTKVPHTVWADGKLRIFNSDTGRYDAATDTKGNEITDELRTPTRVEIDGKTFTVSPNTAAMATATGERFDITESRQEREEQRREERDFRDRTAKAADLAGKIEGARRAMAIAKSRLARNPNSSDAKTEYEEARAYGLQAAKELNEGYGDIYEAGEGAEGTPYATKRDVKPPSQQSNRRPVRGGGRIQQRVPQSDLNRVLGLP